MNDTKKPDEMKTLQRVANVLDELTAPERRRCVAYLVDKYEGEGSRARAEDS